jgi:hypothetical protein
MAVVTINQSSIQGGDTAPDAPTSLVTEKEWDGVRLHWTNPSNKDIAYIEVWRNTTNDRSTSTLIAEIKANDYMDHSLETGTRYYWIRAVSTTDLKSSWYPTSATSGVSGIPDQVDPSGAVDKDLLQYNSATDSWITGAMRDGTLVKGAIQASTDNSYVFPGPALNTTTNNNGFDAVSSFPSGNGNGVQGQFTHYFGDTAAAGNTSAVFTFNTANGNSSTSGTIPWTGLAPSAPSAVTSSSTIGGLNFNGYATTNFTHRVSTSNQGGGFNAVHALQIQGVPAETFADGTLTISGASITAVSRINPTVSSVAVTGTRGQISFTSTSIGIGYCIMVTGSLTGTATGLAAGNYYVINTNGSTTATLSATPGGDPITTTAGTTTGLTFVRSFITVTYSAQSNIPFGLNAKVAVSGITNVTSGTFMVVGTSTTTSVNIGAPSSGTPSLGTTPSLSCPTVTNMGAGFRIRALPLATTGNSGNRVELVNHNASAATYRSDTFNIAGGAYGGTSATRLSVDSTKVSAALPVVFPSYTTTTRNALTPAAGWVIFNTTTVKLECYDGTAWQALF